MKIYAFIIDKEIVIVSLPSSAMLIDEKMLIKAFTFRGNDIVKIEEELQDTPESERAEIFEATNKNHGHDVVLPIIIPTKIHGNDNVASFMGMVENLKALNNPNISVKTLKLGKKKTIGFVITISECDVL